MSEKILCAAIWYQDGKEHSHQPKNIESGYVLCGRRHHNIITVHYDLTGKPTHEPQATQGFITSQDRFVDRKLAATLAYLSYQIDSNKLELYSEDLY